MSKKFIYLKILLDYFLKLYLLRNLVLIISGHTRLGGFYRIHKLNIVCRELTLKNSEIMKNYIFVALLLTILLGAILILPDIASAQTPAPPPMPDKPTQTPIDGGLALLAAAGGGYAIKKLRDKKK